MEIIVRNVKEIKKNLSVLEKKLNVKITLKGKKVIFEGDKVDEFISSRVLQAMGANFPMEEAVLLIDENYMLEEINIKEVTRKTDMPRIKSRLIGQKGRTLELLEELANCYLRLNDNVVSIIGSSDNIKITLNAVKSLINGSKQSNVYSYLEKQRKVVMPGDLGLKIKEG